MKQVKRPAEGPVPCDLYSLTDQDLAFVLGAVDAAARHRERPRSLRGVKPLELVPRASSEAPQT